MMSTALYASQYRRPLLILIVSVLAYVTANVLPIFILVNVMERLPEVIFIARLVAAIGFSILGIYFILTSRVHSESTKGLNTRFRFSQESIVGLYIVLTLAEFGDKTQITTLLNALSSGNLVLILLLGSLAYLTANVIAVYFMIYISKFINSYYLRLSSGIIFILFGILTYLKIL